MEIYVKSLKYFDDTCWLILTFVFRFNVNKYRQLVRN